MSDPNNVLFFADASKESKLAREFLKQRSIRFSEFPPEAARGKSYPAPTLLVYGEVYEGLRAIMLAVARDNNL